LRRTDDKMRSSPHYLRSNDRHIAVPNTTPSTPWRQFQDAWANPPTRDGRSTPRPGSAEKQKQACAAGNDGIRPRVSRFRTEQSRWSSQPARFECPVGVLRGSGVRHDQRHRRTLSREWELGRGL